MCTKIANTKFNQRIILVIFFSFHFQINMQASRLYYFCFSIFLHSSFSVLCFYYRKNSFFFLCSLCFCRSSCKTSTLRVFFVVVGFFSERLTVLVPNWLAANQDASFDQNKCKGERFFFSLILFILFFLFFAFALPFSPLNRVQLTISHILVSVITSVNISIPVISSYYSFYF